MSAGLPSSLLSLAYGVGWTIGPPALEVNEPGPGEGLVEDDGGGIRVGYCLFVAVLAADFAAFEDAEPILWT